MSSVNTSSITIYYQINDFNIILLCLLKCGILHFQVPTMDPFIESQVVWEDAGACFSENKSCWLWPRYFQARMKGLYTDTSHHNTRTVKVLTSQVYDC